MLRFILTRLLLVVPTFLGMMWLVFLFIHFTLNNPAADPLSASSGESEINLAASAQAAKLAEMGPSLWSQYLGYIAKVLQGDFGKSTVSNTSVLTEFAALFPATLELAVCAGLLALVVGVSAGIVAAVNHNTWIDRSVMGISLIGYSVPIFWWGLLLILLLSVQLDITPVSGRIDVQYFIEPVTGFLLIDAWLSQEQGAFASALSHLVLPSIVLGTHPLAVIARMTRSSMLEVLGEDYIRAARAKGLAPLRIIYVHALRNALVSIITVVGLQLGLLFTGAVLTETIFAWPGVGKWLIHAIGDRDYPVMQGGILLLGGLVMLINLLVDLAYGMAHPRIRS